MCPVEQINIRTYISLSVMFVCTACCTLYAINAFAHQQQCQDKQVYHLLGCVLNTFSFSLMDFCCCLPWLSVCLCAFFSSNCVTNYHYLLAIVPLSQLQLPQVIFNPKRAQHDSPSLFICMCASEWPRSHIIYHYINTSVDDFVLEQTT